ncbi:MAG: AAA family ATPase, partial [Candidatus Omnitrophota bacterium]
MYENFYHLKEKPFNLNPDSKFFFPSEKHTEALSSLLYTINERRGFAVITGEIGSGKTTVCRTLLNKLESGTKLALITNTHLTPKQLICAILEELDVEFNYNWSKTKLLACLNAYLIEQLSLNFNVILVIDEAQNLNLKTLEEVRMLSNLETEKEKLIQIVLLGQPELKDKLDSEDLVQLRQRVSIYY